ncbi:MAG: hypothetical protein ACKVPJ_10990 [Chitinophagales bacterium]
MSLIGEYNLKGVMETGCGIVLHENNTFDFYFIYGALDRHGYGSWEKISVDEIELNTRYSDASPFTITKEERRDLPGLIIHFPNYNPILRQETKVEIFSSGNQHESVPDASGSCSFEIASLEKILVTCMFYFDNPATLFPGNPTNNYFEILPNHNLPLTHFQNVRFRVSGNALTGRLHLLDPNRDFEFEKNLNYGI